MLWTLLFLGALLKIQAWPIGRPGTHEFMADYRGYNGPWNPDYMRTHRWYNPSRSLHLSDDHDDFFHSDLSDHYYDSLTDLHYSDFNDNHHGEFDDHHFHGDISDHYDGLSPFYDRHHNGFAGHHGGFADQPYHGDFGDHYNGLSPFYDKHHSGFTGHHGGFADQHYHGDFGDHYDGLSNFFDRYPYEGSPSFYNRHHNGLADYLELDSHGSHSPIEMATENYVRENPFKGMEYGIRDSVSFAKSAGYHSASLPARFHAPGDHGSYSSYHHLQDDHLGDLLFHPFECEEKNAVFNRRSFVPGFLPSPFRMSSDFLLRR